MIVAATPMAPQSVRRGGTLKLHRDYGFGEVSIAPPYVEKYGSQPVFETGTDAANSYLTSGVAALSAKRPGRGGARNRADRESHALTVSQVNSLMAAAHHAESIGLIFTRMITIHWEAAGLPLSAMAKATGRFVDLMTKALSRHGSATAWLWVHENCGPKGGHCHLLAHVPADLVWIISRLQRGWLAKISGRPYRTRVIRSRPIGGKLGMEISNADLHAANLEAAIAYVIKGADPLAVAYFHLERIGEGGRVIGKRCGTSQNIGAKARTQAHAGSNGTHPQPSS